MHSFERTLVGFDLRKSSSTDNFYMTSYDESLRYEEINEKYQTWQSGLNIYSLDPSDIPSLKVPVDARIIAFDLPTQFVTYLINGNVSNPQPLPLLNISNISNDWKFMGFDVVDAITQTSAFHGFDLTTFYLSELMNKHLLSFNGQGLIDDEEGALRVASYFDNLIPEHAPFMPCGVWLKGAVGVVPSTASTSMTERDKS
jgi:hypothetical protein